ncbi:uncharacterized protein LOC126991256 [Eriocheir sinensis]|uniref:uncharacterized protein LOC126991256 n=1 Tax=Eriocheir sinensis TaxID=95602 RepID=UPI0021C8B4D5|nr:uncharacterized protein LOC126991256 [Eriocheir sinensis]
MRVPVEIQGRILKSNFCNHRPHTSDNDILKQPSCPWLPQFRQSRRVCSYIPPLGPGCRSTHQIVGRLSGPSPFSQVLWGVLFCPICMFTTSHYHQGHETTPGNTRNSYESLVKYVFLQVHGTEEGSHYHQGHETTPGNTRNSYESLIKYVFLQVHGTEEGSNYHQGHETTPGNTRNSYESLVKYVFLQVHGTEEGSHYHQGHETTPGNTRNSYESLVKYVFLQVHGTEEGSHYHQGHETTPGNTRNSYESPSSGRKPSWTPPRIPTSYYEYMISVTCLLLDAVNGHSHPRTAQGFVLEQNYRTIMSPFSVHSTWPVRHSFLPLCSTHSIPLFC